MSVLKVIFWEKNPIYCTGKGPNLACQVSMHSNSIFSELHLQGPVL